MNITTAAPITATFRNVNGEWMICADRKITKKDYAKESRMVIGGGSHETDVCRVAVTTKSGATKIVEVLEYAAATESGHFYSVR
jgi:hypothetical protein